MRFPIKQSGLVEVSLTSADLHGVFTELNELGIELVQPRMPDELTAIFSIAAQHLGTLRRCVEKRGDRLKIQQVHGVSRALRQIMQRPVLIIGIVLLLVLECFLPGKVFFFRVEGNETVACHRILEAAEACGIGFGADRSSVRSEKLKNRLLANMPELQWVGVNTYGCLAVITVHERAQVKPEPNFAAGDVIADRDGVIQSCTVTRGSAMCQTGQAVQQGEVLISGTTDCGLIATVTQAAGEVFASTQRSITVISPKSAFQRRQITKPVHRYSLLLQKKRINLYLGSGILDAGCVKMYKECYVTLPGGLRLPFGIRKETITPATLQQVPLTFSSEASRLELAAKQYLQNHMICGTIVRASTQAMDIGDVYCLTGRYACTEMIGREVTQ